LISLCRFWKRPEKLDCFVDVRELLFPLQYPPGRPPVEASFDQLDRSYQNGQEGSWGHLESIHPVERLLTNSDDRSSVGGGRKGTVDADHGERSEHLSLPPE
jgi:hypothetical protein